MHASIHAHMNTYKYEYIYTHIYVHAHIHTHTHTHIHTYIHTHTHTLSLSLSLSLLHLHTHTGIYDELIILHDYPYLNNKMEFVFNETASDVMKAKDLCVINAAGNTLGSINRCITDAILMGMYIYMNTQTHKHKHKHKHTQTHTHTHTALHSTALHWGLVSYSKKS